MDKRHEHLKKLKEFNNNITKEVTFLLQNLQWDPKLIKEKHPMVACRYESNHRIFSACRDAHEQRCQLTKLGYGKDDYFLPDTFDPDAPTLVKLSKHEIKEIINKAAINDPLFKKGCEGPEPLTVERLQRVYSADERRAIHDAVVSTAPFCHDLADLDLTSTNNGAKASQKKSRLEILAELRNMKRRRAKYRVAPKTRNYSDVLRDVIKTQMDTYGEATRTIIKTEYGPNVYVSQRVSNITMECIPHDTLIKQERESPELHSRHQRRDSRESYRRHRRDEHQNNSRHMLHKDYSERNKTKPYARNETSKDLNIDRGRERIPDDRRHRNDKFSSKEISRKYDDRKECDYVRSRERRHDDGRGFTDHSRDSSKHYERVIKQERTSQETDDYGYSSKTHHSRSRYESTENKYSKSERNKRYSPADDRERESSTSDSHRRESSKRHRSRSKEKKHGDKKKRHNKEHTSKSYKEHESRKIRRDHLSDTIIKQERESP